MYYDYYIHCYTAHSGGVSHADEKPEKPLQGLVRATVSHLQIHSILFTLLLCKKNTLQKSNETYLVSNKEQVGKGPNIQCAPAFLMWGLSSLNSNFVNCCFNVYILEIFDPFMVIRTWACMKGL